MRGSCRRIGSDNERDQIMGYQTEFQGEIAIEPPLSAEEIGFLQKFSSTRRMDREKGPYSVDGSGLCGQGNDPDIRNYDKPPEGQPGLWCQWESNENGTAIEWNGAEKFYDADEWMEYIMIHFIGQNPKAKDVLPFLQGHACNGEILATGESGDDNWKIRVIDGRVSKILGRIVYDD